MRHLRPLTVLALLPALGLAGLSALAAPAVAAAPSNDDLADAIPLAATQTVDLADATLEAGETAPCSGIERSAWFEVTPGEATVYRFETSAVGAGDPADTVVSAWTSEDDDPGVDDLTDLGCNDEAPGGGGASSLVVRVAAGQTVWVQAALFAGATAVPFTLTADVVPPPGNDAFAGRQVVSGASGAVTGDNTAASPEAGDPVDPNTDEPRGRSVWYAWTAPASGPVSFTAIGDDDFQDTVLGVYTGDTLAGLQEVAANDDVATGQLWSRASFDAVEGTTYAVLVDGYLQSGVPTGPFTLSWGDPALRSTTKIALPAKGKVGTRPKATITVKVGPRGDTTPGRGRIEVSAQPKPGGQPFFDTLRLDANGRAVLRLPKLKRSSTSVVVTATFAATAGADGSEGTDTIRVR